MLEAVFKHVFHDHARSVCDRTECKELCLHIRWESRVWQRFNQLDLTGTRTGCNVYRIPLCRERTARFTQLCHDGRNMCRNGVLQCDLAARNRCGAQQRSRHDAVRNHPVRNTSHRLLPSSQRMAPANSDRGRARARDRIAQFAQKSLQVFDLGLTRSVLDDRLPFCPHSRHHDVFRCAHARIIQVDVRAGHGTPLTQDQPMLLANLNAEHGKPSEVQVNGPVADLTTAGERANRMPEAGKQRPQHEDG